MDETIFYFFYNIAHQSEIFDAVIIFFAVYFPYLVILGAGLFLLFHHEVFRANSPFEVFLQKKKEILFAFFTGGVAWIFAHILKNVLHTSRPFDTFSEVQSLFVKTGYAFPSGHATFFAALALAIFFIHRKAGYVFILCALLIGVARIAAGVHSPVDILGGFVLGTLVALVMCVLLRRHHS